MMAVIAFLRSQLSFLTPSDTVDTDILLYSPCSKNHENSGGECRYYSQIPCTSVQCVDCCGPRTSNFQLLFGFSRLIIILLLLMSICSRPCSCGLNCTNYNVSCYRGTCVEAKSPQSPVGNVNRTGTVICVCEDRWSGPACEVFSCGGRTLWVPIVITVVISVFVFKSDCIVIWHVTNKVSRGQWTRRQVVGL